MTFCNQCGNPLNGEKFCTKCGAKAPDMPNETKSVGSSPSKHKRRGKLIPIVVLCVVICAGAAAALAFGFNLGSGNDLLGQWELATDVSAPFDELELFSDNTYASDDSNYNGQYSVDGERIRFEGILVSPIDCTYKVDKNTLVITYEDDDVWEFHRVEGTSVPSGNNAKAMKKLQGSWELTNDVSAPFDELEFFSDGKYSSDDSNYNGQYSVDENRIKFEGILVSPIVCSFETDGNELTLSYKNKDTWQFRKLK